jgi:hypothetical protein
MQQGIAPAFDRNALTEHLLKAAQSARIDLVNAETEVQRLEAKSRLELTVTALSDWILRGIPPDRK